MDKQIPLLVIAGPTASGKTKLSIELAKAYNGEIVSADSMQIYKHMSIGTAKPTKEEMQDIPHYLLDTLELDETFSVAQYVSEAKKIIADIHKRGKLPILVGGTGLYISSLIDNIDFSEIKSDTSIRSELEIIGDSEGNQKLLDMLKEIDPEYASTLHENNRGRVIRAIEVYRVTGKPMSWHQEQSRLNPSPYKICYIGLGYFDRALLYDRINQRVNIMVAEGLLKETEELFNSKYSQTAYQAIGYKELKPYFDDEKPLAECLEMVKMQSRRYAKRQLTWFRRDERIYWILVDKQKDFDEILSKAKEYINEQLF